MLVGRKNCRKIVQFLVEPLIKKRQKLIHFTLCEWIFCYTFIQIEANLKRLQQPILSFKSSYLVMNLNFKLYFGMIVGNRLTV